MKIEKRITVALFFVYLVLLTWIILFKFSFSFAELDNLRQINLIPFRGSVVANGKIDFDEIINNVIVFIPVGAYIRLLMPNKSLIQKICPIVGISFLYEALQFMFAIGASDITDLFSNTMGGIIGIAFIRLFSVIFREKTHKICNRVAVVCTIFIVLFLILLLAVNHIL